jgi:hypothetical protein
LLADFTASEMPDWFAMRPSCSESFSEVEAGPRFVRPEWEIGP